MIPTLYLDPEYAEQQLSQIKAENEKFLLIAIIVIGIVAIVYVTVRLIRYKRHRDQMIADLQKRVGRLVSERNRLQTKRCIDAQEKCDIESDCEWRIAEAEKNAEERIKAAEQKMSAAESRTQQSEDLREQIARAADKIREEAVA